MSNLAVTYGELGRHRDALVLKEKTLEFHRRVLPKDHPDIGVACFNLSISHSQAGDNRLALGMAREALCIWKVTYEPSHDRVQSAQNLVRQLESSLGL